MVFSRSWILDTCYVLNIYLLYDTGNTEESVKRKNHTVSELLHRKFWRTFRTVFTSFLLHHIIFFFFFFFFLTQGKSQLCRITRMKCKQLKCSLQEAKPKECCRKCKGCTFKGTYHGDKTQWNDANATCTTYTCHVRNFLQTLSLKSYFFTSINCWYLIFYYKLPYLNSFNHKR